MMRYPLRALLSENIGHVLATIGLGRVLLSSGARIYWESDTRPSSPVLIVDATEKQIDTPVIEGVRALVEDWVVIKTRFLHELSVIQKKGQPKTGFFWDINSIAADFDGIDLRLRERMAPWISSVGASVINSVGPEPDKKNRSSLVATKPRTQLTKTAFIEMFTPDLCKLVKQLLSENTTVAVLGSPAALAATMPYRETGIKTGYDYSTTIQNSGVPQSTVRSRMAHPLIEYLTLEGLEAMSLAPSPRMPRMRLMDRCAFGTMRVPLWTTLLSAYEVEAFLYDAGNNRGIVTQLAKNGQYLATQRGSIERLRGARLKRRRSKGFVAHK